MKIHIDYEEFSDMLQTADMIIEDGDPIFLYIGNNSCTAFAANKALGMSNGRVPLLRETLGRFFEFFDGYELIEAVKAQHEDEFWIETTDGPTGHEDHSRGRLVFSSSGRISTTVTGIMRDGGVSRERFKQAKRIIETRASSRSLELTIHRGSHQIGGTIIELTCNNHRLILDAGSPIEADPDAPEITVHGLFDEGDKCDAILLTHAHPDHYGAIEHTLEDIPVYMTEGTSKMMLAGSIFARSYRVPQSRQKTIKAGKEFSIGPFTITALNVDHSAYDSVAYSIKADGKHLLYTGDLRNHGRGNKTIKDLLKYCSKNPVDVMVSEGTTLNRPSCDVFTEFDLEEKLYETISETKGLVLANFSPQFVDRWVSFFNASKRAGRIFINDEYASYIHYLLKSKFKDLPVASKSMDLKTYFTEHFKSKKVSDKISKPLSRLKSTMIDIEGIISNPEKYVMLFRPSMFKRDFDKKLPEDSTLIYSMWAGYLDTGYCDAVQAELKKRNGRFVKCHSSGHIDQKSLKNIINEINPSTLIPVHTESPEAFNEFCENTLVAQDGERISLN